MLLLILGKLSLVTFMVIVMGTPFLYYYTRDAKWHALDTHTPETWYKL